MSMLAVGFGLLTVSGLYILATHYDPFDYDDDDSTASAAPSTAPTVADFCSAYGIDCGDGASCVDGTSAGVDYT